MKKNLLTLYITAVVLFSDFIMFAGPGAGSDGEPPLEGEDAPAAPINGKLLWLALAGILFAVYAYKRTRRAA